MLDEAHQVQREVNNCYFVVVMRGGTKKCLQNALKIVKPPNSVSGGVNRALVNAG